jgi:predicted nucleic acid-binding protein
MIGLDTSFLVALSICDHANHNTAQALLSREARQTVVVITPAVLTKFVHAVTDPKRFRNPLTMTQAVVDANAWWTARNAKQLFPTDEAMRLCLKWLGEFQLGRKRVLDTMLAATLHTGGVRRLFTLNADDFKVLGVFDLLVP